MNAQSMERLWMRSASVMLGGVELSVKIPGVQEMARIVPVMASVTVLFIHVSARMGGQVMDVTSLTVLEIQTVQTEVKIFIIVEICQYLLFMRNSRLLCTLQSMGYNYFNNPPNTKLSYHH